MSLPFIHHINATVYELKLSIFILSKNFSYNHEISHVSKWQIIEFLHVGLSIVYISFLHVPKLANAFSFE